MRMLWWIVGAVALVTLIWVGLSVATGGLAALGSHLDWFVTLIVAAVAFLMARGGLARWRSIRRENVPFASYPEGHLFGVFHSLDDARAAEHELAEAGFTDGRTKVFVDAKGAAALDSEGTAHGIPAFAERELEHLFADKDDLAGYEQAVRRGAVVIGVAVDTDERGRAVEIFRRHRGDDMNYFGRWAVESISRTPGGRGGHAAAGG